MNTETEETEGVSTNNIDYANSTALQIRLQTQNLIDQIEWFLRGKEPNNYWSKETQSWQTRLIDMGDPLANKKGIQWMLNYCRAIINPQTVQGNYHRDDYNAFIAEKRIEIARACFVNFYDWELRAEDDIAEITDFVMNIIEPFMSRTIDNEERKSYAQTIQTRETNTVPMQKKGIGDLFRQGG